MFLLQIQHEVRQFIRSPLALLLFVFLAGCMAFGVWNGARDLAQKRGAAEAMLQKQTEKFAKLQAQADSINRNLKAEKRWWLDPTSALVIGEFDRGGWAVVLEPASLSILATGLSDLQAEAEVLKISGSAVRSSSDFENPVNLTFGTFDLAFVVTFLLPLFVIALTFNLVSGEREQGTLALLLSQPIVARQLFGLKMLARFSLLGGLVLAVMLSLLAAAGISLAEPALWQAAGLVLLYTLFWFLLALAVNLRGQSSAFNALACVAGWLLLVIVVPALVNLAAEKARPIPSRAGFQNDLRTADLEVARQKERILTEYFQQNPQFVRKADEQKGDKDWWIEEFAVLDFDQSLKDSLADAFEAKAHQQADFAQSLLGLSPALAVHYQLVTLAGTGREATGGYQQNIKKQQQEWSASMRTKYLADQKLTNTDYEAFAALPTRVRAEADMGNAASGWWWLLMQCFLVGGLVWLVSRRPW